MIDWLIDWLTAKTTPGEEAGGGAPYNGGSALKGYQRVGKSRVKVYERVGKFIF